jgi:predicted PurR-regulated permease PerM
MLIYGAAIHFLVGILLFLIAIQFLFYLFTSNTNEQLRSVHNWIQDFFNDALDFLSFNTNSKPWPFKGDEEGSDSSEEEAVDAEEVIEIDAEELDSSDKEA